MPDLRRSVSCCTEGVLTTRQSCNIPVIRELAYMRVLSLDFFQPQSHGVALYAGALYVGIYSKWSNDNATA